MYGVRHNGALDDGVVIFCVRERERERVKTPFWGSGYGERACVCVKRGGGGSKREWWSVEE